MIKIWQNLLFRYGVAIPELNVRYGIAIPELKLHFVKLNYFSNDWGPTRAVSAIMHLYYHSIHSWSRFSRVGKVY